ncbi:MAG TPA: hypothetical protein VF662_14795 [Allosphingosinicella sp.]
MKSKGFTGGMFFASLVAGAVALGGTANAQEKKEERTENIIIKRYGKDSKPIVLDGKELSEFRSKCNDANKAESDVTSGDGNRKFVTRVVVCGDKGESSADVRGELVKALEKARAELSERDSGDAQHRAEAIAALDREIARVKAQKD